MSDIDALGQFWWSDAQKGEGNTIPEKLVIGRLRTKDGEKITLELFGFLNEIPKSIHFSKNFQLKPGDRKIFGIIKDTNNFVIINEYYESPHISSQGENFQIRTMVLCAGFPSCLRFVGVSKLIISLEPISYWLNIGSIEISVDPPNTEIRHRKQENREYQSVGRKILLNSTSKLQSQNFLKSDKVELEEKFDLVISYDEPTQLDVVQKDYIDFCDFIFLLIDQDMITRLPKLEICGILGELIYWRESRPDKELRHFNYWVNFKLIDSNFGKFFDEYQKLSAKFKAGFYLLFAASRAEKIYEEHKFFNLVSGLETFHREKEGDSDIDQEIVERIARITKVLENADSVHVEDKEWLAKKLEFTKGSVLSKRLGKLFKKTKKILKYEGIKIESFISKCVENRDMIAHRGGPFKKLYNNFFDEIDRLSGALRIFYVVNILLEIGIAAEIVEKSIAFNQRNDIVLPAFRDVGLVAPAEPTILDIPK